MCKTWKVLTRQGTLEGYDNTTNLILTSAKERIFDEEEDTEHIDLGLFVVRGDSVVCIGVVEEEIEKSIKWSEVHGVQLNDTKNPV